MSFGLELVDNEVLQGSGLRGGCLVAHIDFLEGCNSSG